MPSLMEQLTPTGANLTDARREYAELLGRGDAPKPGDVERLRVLMDVLGLAQADVAAHIAAREQAAGYERQLDAMPATDTPDEQRQAAELVPEVDRLQKELYVKQGELQELRSVIGQRERTRWNLMGELARLKESHPIAWGTTPPAPRRVTTTYTRHDADTGADE